MGYCAGFAASHIPHQYCLVEQELRAALSIVGITSGVTVSGTGGKMACVVM